MTRKEQLVFCEKCNHRAMDHHQGLICGLTAKQAEFTEVCPDFSEDTSFREETIKKIERIRPNNERAKLAQVFVWVVLALDMISIVSSLIQINLLKEAKSGYTITEDVEFANNLREMAVSATNFLAYIISGIIFIRWFRRAYYNLSVRTTLIFLKDGHQEVGLHPL